MAHHDIAQAAEAGAARRQALVTSFGARALTEGFDLDALLAEAAAHAAAGLGVERAQVLQHRPEAGDLLVRAGVGWKPGVVGRATLPAGMASPPGRKDLSSIARPLFPRRISFVRCGCAGRGARWSRADRSKPGHQDGRDRPVGAHATSRAEPPRDTSRRDP